MIILTVWWSSWNPTALGFACCYRCGLLRGLNSLFPVLVSFPLVTKKELDHPSLFYDAYYDFGIFSNVAFRRSWELRCYFLVRRRRKMSCPAGHVIYAQDCHVHDAVIFTTWFSNPATWFYLAVTGIIYMYVKSVTRAVFGNSDNRSGKYKNYIKYC